MANSLIAGRLQQKKQLAVASSLQTVKQQKQQMQVIFRFFDYLKIIKNRIYYQNQTVQVALVPKIDTQTSVVCLLYTDKIDKKQLKQQQLFVSTLKIVKLKIKFSKNGPTLPKSFGQSRCFWPIFHSPSQPSSWGKPWIRG